MKWTKISVICTHESGEAVTSIFYELGVGGLDIEDPRAINKLRNSEWELTDIPEQENIDYLTIAAYVSEDVDLKNCLQTLQLGFKKIDKIFPNAIKSGPNVSTVAEEDWANCWKQYFHPLRIGKRIVIKPSWEDYHPIADGLVIEIDPGMAFGTGTHHTTSLCAQMLEKYVQPGMRVFDVGTGSGILAMIAGKLGAGHVKAVDLDENAVRVATDNIAINGLENLVSVDKGDLLSGVVGVYDIIVANIIADVIIKLLPDVISRLSPSGIFIASGIILERQEDVIDTARRLGFEVQEKKACDGWVVLVLSKGKELCRA